MTRYAFPIGSFIFLAVAALGAGIGGAVALVEVAARGGNGSLVATIICASFFVGLVGVFCWKLPKERRWKRVHDTGLLGCARIDVVRELEDAWELELTVEARPGELHVASAAVPSGPGDESPPTGHPRRGSIVPVRIDGADRSYVLVDWRAVARAPGGRG